MTEYVVWRRVDDLKRTDGRPVLAPAYDPATGTVTWDFDTGTADVYTIPAGETLRLVYTVQADASLGPGLELTNTALATTYYSFDDEAVPVYLGQLTLERLGTRLWFFSHWRPSAPSPVELQEFAAALENLEARSAQPELLLIRPRR